MEKNLNFQDYDQNGRGYGDIRQYYDGRALYTELLTNIYNQYPTEDEMNEDYLPVEGTHNEADYNYQGNAGGYNTPTSSDDYLNANTVENLNQLNNYISSQYNQSIEEVDVKDRIIDYLGRKIKAAENERRMLSTENLLLNNYLQEINDLNSMEDIHQNAEKQAEKELYLNRKFRTMKKAISQIHEQLCPNHS